MKVGLLEAILLLFNKVGSFGYVVLFKCFLLVCFLNLIWFLYLFMIKILKILI